MTESDEDNVIDQIQNRIEDTKGTVEEALSEASEGGMSAVNDAVTIADEGVNSAGTFINEMGQDAFEVLQAVLNSVWKYADENDLSITVSSDKIHVEGDTEGVKKVAADIENSEEINKEASVEFERKEGLDIEFRDPEQ